MELRIKSSRAYAPIPLGLRRGQHACLAVLLAIASTACEKKPPPPTLVPAPSPSLQKPAIAKLTDFQPKVVFRRSEDLQWQDPSANLPLFALDAVQTRANAIAHIQFQSGSQIEMGENTLVIIRESNSPSDRAVFRGGKLTSKTHKELWLLTSAAILKLKAKSAGDLAEVKISGSEGKEIRFELAQGEGILVRRNRDGLQSTPLRIASPVSVPAPIGDVRFGIQDESPLESAGKTNKRPSNPRPTSKMTPTPTKASLSITSPANYQEVTSAEVSVHGLAEPSTSKILVNGQLVELVNGQFSQSLKLDMGANTIVIELLEPDGNSIFKRISVQRKNPQ